MQRESKIYRFKFSENFLEILQQQREMNVAEGLIDPNNINSNLVDNSNNNNSNSNNSNRQNLNMSNFFKGKNFLPHS